MSEISTLPPQAFDGQIFIDAFRVKWEYDGSANCWRKIGTCPDIPVASELQTGLLSARLKQLLDGIPPGGGHFGIVAHPLLSLVPQNPNILHRDEVVSVSLTKSGTQLSGKSLEDRLHTPEQYVGKLLLFKTGVLSKKGFLIFTNDTNTLFLEGDATEAVIGDKYEIVDPQELNPSGILLGDIMLVSNTIDITCVDGEGLPLVGGEECNLDVIKCDNVARPPGLNFQLNPDFLDSLCVIVPGCQGPRGARGKTGEQGADGTGDGPVGDIGDPGVDAPLIPNAFAGVRIVDTDDIYDTAVVSMELDAEAGKLTVIRAKVRTPDADTPATQLISTPINRSLDFVSNESFNYSIKKPNVDPIDELDVDILKYPRGFVSSDGQAETIVNKIKLSDIVNAVISHYEEKLEVINGEYNQQLKNYIEDKDAVARTILANLAQQVAECEFELPIDFCLGISPDDCNKVTAQAAVPFSFPLSGQLFSFPTDEGPESVTAISNGNYFVPAFNPPPPVTDLEEDIIPGGGFIDDRSQAQKNYLVAGGAFILIKSPSNAANSQSATLEPGHYVVIFNGGTGQSSESDGHVVGTGKPTIGLQVCVENIAADGNMDPVEVVSASPPGLTVNAYEEGSVTAGYENGPLVNKAICFEIGENGGTARLAMPLPGKNATGGANLEVFHLCGPAGMATLI